MKKYVIELLTYNILNLRIMCEHNHKICHNIRIKLGHNENIGIGFLVCREENGELTIMLGRQQSGQNAGKYDICMGKLESTDKNCFFETLKRIARQEFKLTFNSPKEMFNVFVTPNTKRIRFVILDGMLIFIGMYQRYQFSFTQLQNVVRSCANNANLLSCDRNIDDLMMLKINPQFSFLKQLKNFEQGFCTRHDGTVLKISPFAKKCSLGGLFVLQVEGLFRNHAK